MKNNTLRKLNNKEMQMIAGGNLEAPLPASHNVFSNIKRLNYLYSQHDELLSDRAAELHTKFAISA